MIKLTLQTRHGPAEITCAADELPDVLRALGSAETRVRRESATTPAAPPDSPPKARALNGDPRVELDETQRRLPTVLRIVRKHPDGIQSDKLAKEVGMSSRGLSAVVRLVKRLADSEGLEWSDVLRPGKPGGRRGWYPGKSISVLMEGSA